MPTLTGRCLCGTVHYRTDAEPVFAGVCHCTDCQRFTGAGASAEFAVPKAAVSMSGALSSHTVTGDSGGKVTRFFCPTCGSGVKVEISAMPDLVLIGLGTLDNRSAVSPSMHIYCDSAQPWDRPPAGVAAFGRMPPMGS